jgi:hypothetical protein
MFLTAGAGPSVTQAAENPFVGTGLPEIYIAVQQGDVVQGTDTRRSSSAAGAAAGTQETSSSATESYPGFDLSRMDKDGDKKVSKQEYSAHFDDMDKDKNGFLDANEIREAALTGQAAPVSTSD